MQSIHLHSHIYSAVDSSLTHLWLLSLGIGITEHTSGDQEPYRMPILPPEDTITRAPL